MKLSDIVTSEDQRVTFVELFFDLVFVFSITQIVGYFHDGPTAQKILQAILVFWLVWWAWQQFTWALNSADTTHPLIELSVLVATGVAFFMAASVAFAFGERSLEFAFTYVVVRLIGLVLFSMVLWNDKKQRLGVERFNLVSIGGLIAVLLGGYLGGTAQLWLWGLAIVLDILAAQLGGQAEGWDLRPEHFVERHGLFVIIALGESLIVAAGGVSGTIGDLQLLLVGVLAVALTGGLWWTYFARAQPALNEAFAAEDGSAQARLARDAFSLLHFVMLCGVIAFAATLEEIVAHPDEPLTQAGRIALALGVGLFVGGMAAALYRATRQWLTVRLILTGLTALAIATATGVTLSLSLGIALLGVLAIAIYEQRKEPFVNIRYQEDSAQE